MTNNYNIYHICDINNSTKMITFAKTDSPEIKTEINCLVFSDYLRVPNNAYFCEEKEEIFINCQMKPRLVSVIDEHFYRPATQCEFDYWNTIHHPTSDNSKVYNRVLDDFNVEMFCSNS